jgi:hypothetical protein
VAVIAPLAADALARLLGRGLRHLGQLAVVADLVAVRVVVEPGAAAPGAPSAPSGSAPAAATGVTSAL